MKHSFDTYRLYSTEKSGRRLLIMDNQKDIRFFPVFAGATTGVVLEVIATLVDEIIIRMMINLVYVKLWFSILFKL